MKPTVVVLRLVRAGAQLQMMRQIGLSAFCSELYTSGEAINQLAKDCMHQVALSNLSNIGNTY